MNKQSVKDDLHHPNPESKEPDLDERFATRPQLRRRLWMMSI